MPLVPVDDARQRHLVAELLPGDLHARRTEADALRHIAYPQHGHPFTGDVASLAEVLEAVAPAVMPRDHTQARRATVHRIELAVYLKVHRLKDIILILNAKADWKIHFLKPE